MKSLTKYLLVIILISVFILGSCSAPQPYYYGYYAKVRVEKQFNPKGIKIIVMPTKSVGNPSEQISVTTTEKFVNYLTDFLGFSIVSGPLLESAFMKFSIDKTKDISIEEMKKLCTELNCSAIFISTLTYSFISGSSQSTTLGTKNILRSDQYSKEGSYEIESETAYLINPFVGENIMSGNINFSAIPSYAPDYSMSRELCAAFYRHLYNDWPK